MPTEQQIPGIPAAMLPSEAMRQVGIKFGEGQFADLQPGELPSRLPDVLKPLAGLVGLYDEARDRRLREALLAQDAVFKGWQQAMIEAGKQAATAGQLPRTQGELAMSFPSVFTAGMIQPRFRTGQLELQGPPTQQAILAIPQISEEIQRLQELPPTMTGGLQPVSLGQLPTAFTQEAALANLRPGEVPRLTRPIQEFDPMAPLSPLEQQLSVKFLTQQAEEKAKGVKAESPLGKLIADRSKFEQGTPEYTAFTQQINAEVQGVAPKAVSDENRLSLAHFRVPYLQGTQTQQLKVNELLNDEFRERNRFRLEQQVIAQVEAAKRIEKEVPKRPSAKQLDDLADQLTTISQTQNILQTFDPRFIGPMAGRFGNLKEMIGAIGGDEAAFRASTARLRNATIKAITGAQMGEREADRIRQELPEFNLKPEAFIARLKLTFMNMHEMAIRYRKILKQGGVDVDALDPVPDIPEALQQENRETLRQLGGIAGIPKVRSEKDYDALPKGSKYLAPDGTQRRKQ